VIETQEQELIRTTLPPLYEIEDTLVALLDTEDSVLPEQEAAFRSDLAIQLQKAVAKRDRVGAFIRMCEQAAANTAEEIKRLQTRKRVFENTVERVRGYVVSIIESLGRDEKGKLRKLPGSNFTLTARACAPSLEIDDETQVPKAYKRVRVDLPVETWEAIRALPGFLEPAPVGAYYVDSAALKAALESPEPCTECKPTGLTKLDAQIRQQCPACKGTGRRVIPGAHLITGKHALVIR